MGVDAGFDMVPRLTKGAEDKRDWDGFIQEVKNHYLFDGRMAIMSTHLLFDAGEQPTLPFDGHKFLRFSSKVSGSSTAGSIIRTISRIAETRFGSRICYWNEGADSYSFYDWLAVNASLMCYDKVRRLTFIYDCQFG
nr:hypothetical protein CFP56_28765 [Quercus suber]